MKLQKNWGQAGEVKNYNQKLSLSLYNTEKKNYTKSFDDIE